MWLSFVLAALDRVLLQARLREVGSWVVEMDSAVRGVIDHVVELQRATGPAPPDLSPPIERAPEVPRLREVALDTSRRAIRLREDEAETWRMR